MKLTLKGVPLLGVPENPIEKRRDPHVLGPNTLSVSLDIQSYLLRRYLDPKNRPTTLCQEVFGCLGYVVVWMFGVNDP